MRLPVNCSSKHIFMYLRTRGVSIGAIFHLLLLPFQTLTKELMVKHPLQNRWSLWFFKNDKAKNWAANLRQITTFDSVEDFWSIYNHIQLASKLSVGCDYSLFKVVKMSFALSQSELMFVFCLFLF